MAEVRLNPIAESSTAAPGTRLLDVLLGHKCSVMMACGGQAICATCHVYIESGKEALNEISEREKTNPRSHHRSQPRLPPLVPNLHPRGRHGGSAPAGRPLSRVDERPRSPRWQAHQCADSSSPRRARAHRQGQNHHPHTHPRTREKSIWKPSTSISIPECIQTPTVTAATASLIPVWCGVPTKTPFGSIPLWA